MGAVFFASRENVPEVRPRSVLRLGSRSLISNSQCSQRAAASLRAGVSFVSCWRLLVWRRDALGFASLLPPVPYSLIACSTSRQRTRSRERIGGPRV